MFPIYPYICQRACFDIKGPAVSLEGVYGDGRWLWIEWLPRPDQRLSLTFGDSLAHFWLSKVYKGHAIGLLESRGCFETAKTMILFSERKKSTFNKSHIFGSLCNYSSICFICIVVKKKNWKKKKKLKLHPTPWGAFWQNWYCLGWSKSRCSHCPCGARRFLLLLQNNRLWCHAKLWQAVSSDLVNSPGLPVFLPEDDHPWWICLCVINSGFGAFWRGWFI